MTRSNWRNVAITLVAIAGLLTTPPTSPVQARGNPNPGVLPPNSRPFGVTYGEWSAKWWQWAFSIPANRSPLLDNTGANCAEGQTNRVWFLAGTGGGSLTRTCTIPPGRPILIPIVTVTAGAGTFDCDPTAPGVPCDVPALRALLASFLDNPTLLEVEVDGRPLQNLTAYRAISPEFSITYPPDSITGVPAGTYSPQVSDGYWIMLAPLSVGTHTIRARGIIDFFGDPFESDVTYQLTIGR